MLHFISGTLHVEPGRTPQTYLCPECKGEVSRFKMGVDMSGLPCDPCRLAKEYGTELVEAIDGEFKRAL